jgi:2-succinyl-5-enolpyruvyl-6-hydroxy-3-cyclohexene-1-carboxylate synthase
MTSAGLLAARRHELPLTIVRLNDDGGGIFHSADGSESRTIPQPP